MPTSDEIDNLIKQLSHKNKAELINAEVKLSRLGIEVMPLLLKFVQEQWRRYSKRQLLLRKCGQLLSPFGMMLVVIGMYFKPPDMPKDGSSPLSLLGILPVIIGTVLILTNAGMPRALESAYRILTEISDPRAFSILLESLVSDNGLLSAQSLAVVSRLLPLVSLSEWENLSSNQRKGFYRILQTNATWRFSFIENFTLSALKALEQIGDDEAIPTVERIAKKGRSELVRQAARECLPYLQVRREEQTKRETLLRASESTGGKDELLRVPAQANLSETEQLLRVPKEE